MPTTVEIPRPLWPGRLGLAVMTTARILLGIGMMPYAINKIFDYQFQVSAWKYAQSFGNINGKGLTWAMMGYSPAFQTLLGFLEFIPALLLFFNRTRRLGAVMMFPVALNVFLINVFLKLWPTTQLISGIFLALNLIVLLYDLPLYRSFLGRLLAPSTPIASRRWRLAAKIAGFAIPAVIVGYSCFSDYRGIQEDSVSISDFIGARQINGAGTWKIVSLNVAGQPIAVDAHSRFFFDFSRVAVFGDAQHPNIGKFDADKSHGTFAITKVAVAGSADPITGTYQVQGKRLLLNGVRDNQPVIATLEQDNWGPIR